MDELHHLKKTLQPLAVPLAVMVVMLVVSHISFAEARRVEIPPDPAELFVERVRIDDVRHTLEPMGPSGPALKTSTAVRLASSTDWPGITFQFEGAAAAVSIMPPVIFDLYLASTLEEQADRRRQWPNLYPTLQVYGIAQGGEVLLDAQAVHTTRIDRKRRSEYFGYGLLAMALIPGTALFRRGRKILRQGIS